MAFNRPIPPSEQAEKKPGGGSSNNGGIQTLIQAEKLTQIAFVLPVAYFGWPAEAEQEEMLALDIRQHEGARDAIEHVRRWRAATSLFKPCVPSWAYIGALRHLLATQTRRAPTLGGQAERGRVKLHPPVPEIGSQQFFGREGFAHPVSYLNMIISLLYQNRP